ncbi:MAG: diacylglycerol kinase family protein [Pseudolysinimonas sp.]|uniref:diacylglycerol kinase family protein n=1 Tax=Pseudolysinimonas sp. TaxID=2680009 RepID=UPI003263CB06
MTTVSRKKLVVAINPSASFGASRHVGPAVVQTLRAMGHEVTSLTEPDFEQLLASARAALKKHPDALVMVGGDGMVNLGTNLVAGTRVPLAIIPSGTGNDMARALGIPFDNTEAAIASLNAALAVGPRTIDAGRISWTDPVTGEAGERWFACALSAGFDAIVNERANNMEHPKGPSRYIIAMLAELVKLKPLSYRLTIDGTVLDSKAVLVAIGNGVSLGGGMKITPDAKLDDGLLDVLVVQPLSRTAFLRIFPRVFKGTHVTDPRVQITRAKKVRIEAEGIAAYGDGERIALLPIDVEVVPGALRVLSPLP